MRFIRHVFWRDKDARTMNEYHDPEDKVMSPLTHIQMLLGVCVCVS